MSIGGMPSTHDRDDRTLNDPSAPLLPSSDEAPTTRMAPPADNSTLLADILKLTLPLSATTVVECEKSRHKEAVWNEWCTPMRC